MTSTRMPYILEDEDRHGNVRVYFYKRGCKKVRLPNDRQSLEFMQAYTTARAAALPLTPKVDRDKQPSAGSLRSLVVSFYDSAEFKENEQSTQRLCRLILDKFCLKHGHLPYLKMEPSHVRRFRDAKAETPDAANKLVKLLRQVFAHGIAIDRCKTNPARDVPMLDNNNPDGHHSWTLEEVEEFEARHPLGTRAHLAMALMLYTSQRRSDIVLLGRQHIKNGRLAFTQQKNKRRNPVKLQIPIRPELQHVLDNSQCGDMTFLVTAFGKAFTPAGFGNWFREQCDMANLRHCSAHGLRKAAAARLAEAGASEKEIMAITGHRTSKEIMRYTKAAEQRKLADNAMAKLKKEDR